MIDSSTFPPQLHPWVLLWIFSRWLDQLRGKQTNRTSSVVCCMGKKQQQAECTAAPSCVCVFTCTTVGKIRNWSRLERRMSAVSEGQRSVRSLPPCSPSETL